MKSKSLFLIWRSGRLADAGGGIAGFQRHPAWPGLSSVWRNGGGGAKFVSKSFVHAARKPEIGSFIRAAHMTGGDGLFKAGIPLSSPNDELKERAIPVSPEGQ